MTAVSPRVSNLQRLWAKQHSSRSCQAQRDFRINLITGLIEEVYRGPKAYVTLVKSVCKSNDRCEGPPTTAPPSAISSTSTSLHCNISLRWLLLPNTHSKAAFRAFDFGGMEVLGCALRSHQETIWNSIGG